VGTGARWDGSNLSAGRADVADVKDPDSPELFGCWPEVAGGVDGRPGVRGHRAEEAAGPREAVAGGHGHALREPQSTRPFIASADMNSRWPYTETSPWPPGQIRDVSSFTCEGLSIS
jgi:hypothetical protein